MKTLTAMPSLISGLRHWAATTSLALCPPDGHLMTGSRSSSAFRPARDQIASFFDAHGLGAAYRKAGGNSSKRAKINAALHASDLRGDVDDILRSHMKRPVKFLQLLCLVPRGAVLARPSQAVRLWAWKPGSGPQSTC